VAGGGKVTAVKKKSEAAIIIKWKRKNVLSFEFVLYSIRI
jgi:hypothetical protein